MNITIDELKGKVEDIFREIIQIRRDLHRHPELSEHEECTERLICTYLEGLGIPFQNHIAGHGVCGVIYGRNREQAVGIRADIDALPIDEKTDLPFRSQNPGVMHACGHDMHTAILLGTAKILNDMKDELPFSVKLFFQPSEETIGGARQMIEAGCLLNPQANSVIGLHVAPELKTGSVQFTPGSMNAASCEFYVTVHGRQCHGAHPARGTDPLIPACEMVTAVQSLITRKIEPTDSALITVGQFHSGTKNNIIPDETDFSGIIRTLRNDQRSFIKKKLNDLCCGIALAHGASCTVEFFDSYPALVNDPQLFDIMVRASEELFGEDNVSINTVPSLGSDDFSYFCQSAKGLYFNLGTAAPEDEDAAPVHTSLFCPDENSLKTGILAEVWGVLKIMAFMAMS